MFWASSTCTSDVMRLKKHLKKKKKPNQTNCDRCAHVRPVAATTAGRPKGQRSMAGERRTSAAKWGEAVHGAGSGSGESYAAED